jgi:hypothetical protein
MCECHQIGGRFIAEDPDCPVHGRNGQYEKVWDLLGEVMQNPEYLTDPYYRDLGHEFQKRYEKLRANR